MNNGTQEAQPWPARWASASYAYVTTIGRRTGRPHRIEIWFAVEEGHMYLLSGGRERSDWVRNLQANAQVTVELGDETHTGRARVLEPGTVEDERARALLVGKYRSSDDNLDAWGRSALPIVIEFAGDGDAALDTGSSAQRGQSSPE